LTTKEQVIELISQVNDPEVPVLSVFDLGVVRNIEVNETTRVAHVQITPTYSGCPAMDVISTEIKIAITSRGFPMPIVELVLSPAWTTDWISEAGKEKLRKYGIAPPMTRADRAAEFGQETEVPCPRCESTHTEQLSLFGSTACKALHRCLDCLEPFDYFKCH
jgi:ring-1,2-phenylacetyl-CoA epoxidase subunit PaaD